MLPLGKTFHTLIPSPPRLRCPTVRLSTRDKTSSLSLAGDIASASSRHCSRLDGCNQVVKHVIVQRLPIRILHGISNCSQRLGALSLHNISNCRTSSVSLPQFLTTPNGSLRILGCCHSKNTSRCSASVFTAVWSHRAQSERTPALSLGSTTCCRLGASRRTREISTLTLRTLTPSRARYSPIPDTES